MGSIDNEIIRLIETAVKAGVEPLQKQIDTLGNELWRRERRQANALGFTFEGAKDIGDRIGELLWQAPAGLTTGGVRIPYMPPIRALAAEGEAYGMRFSEVEVRVRR